MIRTECIDQLHDFGGDGPIIHLAHANGFPPGTYRQLAETLTPGFRVIALPARPLWPNSRPESAPTWHPLAQDLIRGLDALELTGIIGLGHSLGGVLTLCAAIRRPDLFRALVLIDPVILPPSWLWALRLLHGLGLSQRLPLVQNTLRRRRIWATQQACWEHYRTRTLFLNWPDSVLWDYVHYGTRSRDDGQIELSYPPEWEAHIFATPPTSIWHDIRPIGIPTFIIRGENSSTFRSAAQRRMARRLPEARFLTVPGAGHLVPMEKPSDLGSAIGGFAASPDVTSIIL